jgi:tetratricopeptide (TPR) repeat protein
MLFLNYCAALPAIFLVIGTAAAADGSKNDCAQLSGDAAITACEKAIGENPNDPFSYFYRGVEYKKKGDIERSLTDYDKAIALNPKIAVFYNNRGNAFQDIYGHGLALRGLGHGAVASAELALAKSIKSDIADIYAQYFPR